jgi:antitoxin (DNA-binding transcriptional repressor) of toxin-antitoxin stability system
MLVGKNRPIKLLARVEAGEAVEIARDGVPVARLVPIDLPSSPGQRFFAARGSLAGRISMAEDFELSKTELDDMLDGTGVSTTTTYL